MNKQVIALQESNDEWCLNNAQNHANKQLNEMMKKIQNLKTKSKKERERSTEKNEDVIEKLNIPITELGENFLSIRAWT